MLNCNIPRDNEETNNPRGEIVGGVLKGVYKCHVCFDLHDSVPQLKSHLQSHASDVQAKGGPKRDDQAVNIPQRSNTLTGTGRDVTPVITVRKFTTDSPLGGLQPRPMHPFMGQDISSRFGPMSGVSIFPHAGSLGQLPPSLNLLHPSMMNPVSAAPPGVNPFFITPTMAGVHAQPVPVLGPMSFPPTMHPSFPAGMVPGFPPIPEQFASSPSLVSVASTGSRTAMPSDSRSTPR